MSFKEKRTFRSKALVGVGALLTKKKLKCRVCGSYNATGRAKPYVGPSSQRLGKKYGTFTNMHGHADGAEVVDETEDEEVDDTSEPLSVADEIGKLAALRDQGVLTDEEFAAEKQGLLGGES